MRRGHKQELQTWVLIFGSMFAAWVVGCTAHINLGEGNMAVESHENKPGHTIKLFEVNQDQDFEPICADHECENIIGL